MGNLKISELKLICLDCFKKNAPYQYFIDGITLTEENYRCNVCGKMKPIIKTFPSNDEMRVKFDDDFDFDIIAEYYKEKERKKVFS